MCSALKIKTCEYVLKKKKEKELGRITFQECSISNILSSLDRETRKKKKPMICVQLCVLQSLRQVPLHCTYLPNKNPKISKTIYQIKRV